MMKTIDLTAIRRRLAPRPKLTALEEWRRMERMERRRANLETAYAAALAVGVGFGVWLVAEAARRGGL